MIETPVRPRIRVQQRQSPPLVPDLPVPAIAILIPCYNEELSIQRVVGDFALQFPRADIYVYDNNSTDRTCETAARSGAIVRSEARQGKGHVVRRMLADIEADYYILVDGDATYDAAAAPKMLERLQRETLDMVVGVREHRQASAYRLGHQFGNWLLTTAVRGIFGRSFTDMLSGYRVFSRRFVKSFPALSEGFEIETELTVHALELGLPTAEVTVPYHPRPEGSHSKLSTVRDGLRILRMIFRLYRAERPLTLFSGVATGLAIASVVMAWPVIMAYLQTGLVQRLPTAVLCMGMMLLGSLSLVCGLILETVTRGRREMKRLAYLAQHGPLRP